ncbi:MAG: Ig-like domain-containing protein [Solirubrobacterales bacterium]|nr:Ig-like domain-containing protein [Solirubrobacterales bacterium]
MRETTGRQRRVSTKLKAAAVALLAIFAFGAASATSAQAGERLDMTFNDSWIKLPALEPLGLKPVHALDPSDGKNLTVAMGGTLDPATGAFASKAADFTFPEQVFEVSPGSNITLSINALNDFTGNYNKSTGAFTVTLPLKLTVDAPSFAVKCELRPLTIPLSSSGAPINFAADADPPNPKAGAPFAAPSNAGAVNGSWTNVTAANAVFGIAAYSKDEATMTDDCKTLIASLAGGEDTSFDGSIWLGGTSKVSTTVDPTCPEGTTGTYPDCVPIDNKTPYAVSKIKLSPSKGKLKAGKKVKLKIKVTNSGETDGSSKVTIKSSNKKVKAPKSVTISVAAGATVTKTIKPRCPKKAKGKAKITAKAGGKSGKAKFKIKKAKKKK